jgi:acyl-CoA thioesterase-1
MKSFLLILLTTFLVSCSENQTTPDIVEDSTIPKVILALGDSLTAWYGLPATDSYPAQLQAELQVLGYSYEVRNAGISGDTTAWLLSRLDWTLEWDAPALVILCIGANDAFQWKNTDDIEANLRQIIEKIQAKNIPIVLGGMKAPLNLGGEYGRKYEAIFPKLAKEYDLIYMDFFLDGVALKANLNLDDRIHPNKLGYAIVVENLIEIIDDEELLKK